MNEELISPLGTIKLADKTLLVSKPTEKDIFSIFQNAKKQSKRLYNPFKETVDALAGLGISDEQMTAILLQSARVKNSGEVPIEVITDYLTSADGCAFYAFILIRKNHPDITLEELKKCINDDNCVMIYAELDEASGVNLIHKSIGESDFFPPV